MSSLRPLAVYDGSNRWRLAYLENAYNISYDLPINALWTGGFSLPKNDPKNDYCQPFNLIEIWDVDGSGGDRYIGLFRIMPKVETLTGVEASVDYQLEHVLNTLLDDILVGWHEIGNTGVYTTTVLNYILQRQTTQRWRLGVCDYSYQYLYGWQDENLLSALFGVAKPFIDTDYYWDFDTKTFPWTLNLRRANMTPKADIRYRKNLRGITRTSDPTNLTTRLYCYGYAEGDNKLTLESVNNGQLYIDSPNTSKYGVITQVWTDESITIADTLLATGRKMLTQLQDPLVTYEIEIETINEAGSLMPGDAVRVAYEDLDQTMVVKKLTKQDVSGRPQNGSIVLGQGTVDLGTSVADLAERQRISETYAQGSESIFMDSFYDNADSSYPANIKFFVPDNAVHVNEIRFSASLTQFRAYSRSTEAGGQTSTTSEYSGYVATASSYTGLYGATEGPNPPDFYISSNLAHTHRIDLGNHDHEVELPAHAHDFTLPNHYHDILYGIYQGPSASYMQVYLDNVYIGQYSSSVRDLNLISYMSKNANGQILRGEHTIRIVPSGLTRIEGHFQIRLFTNARGGGQY